MTEYAIRLTRLQYSYPDGTKALDNVDLDIGCGERVGIVGPSGAGKSTLLLQLNGVLKGAGTVRILGETVDGGDLRRVRKSVGLVFQDPNDQLFCPTVFDDVAFGPLNLGLPPQEVARRVEDALRTVGLDHAIRSRPSHHLSLGERKRVALATVLAMGPEILAFDEPSSSLDPRNRRHLINVVSGLPATLVLATHDLEMVLALCARTILIDRGKIWADADTRRLLSDERLMEEHGLEVPLSLRCR